MQRSRKQKKPASKGPTQSHEPEPTLSKPASGKQKKELMKLQKERNRQKALQRAYEDEEEDRRRLESYEMHNPFPTPAVSEPVVHTSPPADVIPDFRTTSTKDLRTVFLRESDEQVDQRKRDSRTPYTRAPLGPLGLASDEAGYFSEIIDIPRRPNWTKSMTKAQLDANENNYFVNYLTELYSRYSRSRLNTFEHNLEVWRQLWRVCEQSDILLVLADSRHPLFNFPPSLYRYVTEQLQKPMVLVLTKTDLVPEMVLQAWIAWFRENYPALYVVQFSCCPVTEEVKAEDPSTKKRGAKKRQQLLKSSKVRVPLGRERLFEKLQVIVRDYYEQIFATDDAKQQFSLESTHYQRAEASQGTEPKHDDDTPGVEDDTRSEASVTDEEAQNDESDDDGLEQPEEADTFPERDHDRLVQPFITLGTIGHPNAGKSSMINSLVGKKVVSVSRTPGHTKHLQTIFLNPFTRLCDCPGLVFPAVDMPLALQILCGLINIAQVREPYTTIAFAAARIPLEKIYKLSLPPDSDENDATVDTYPWSGWTIAEAWAIKRGYFTQKGAPDRHRAGNEILRDLHEGRVVLALAPPVS